LFQSQFVVDHDYRGRAVFCCVIDLGCKECVLRRSSAGEFAILVLLLRLLANHDHDLALDVDIGVFVEFEFRRCDSVTNKGDLALDRT